MVQIESLSILGVGQCRAHTYPRLSSPIYGGGRCKISPCRFTRLRWWSQGTYSAKMRFGVGADVGETGWVGHSRRLAGFRVRPALALLEFDLMIVEQSEEFEGCKRWANSEEMGRANV